MAKQESPLAALEPFLPVGSFDAVMFYFREYCIHLTLTQNRKTRLGDYRPPERGKSAHQISVNGTLNKYNFLITLLHEIAHLLTYVEHKNRVAPHGPEWKKMFQRVLAPFLGKNIFPVDLEKAISHYLKNPAASSCGDPELYKALRRYDQKTTTLVSVEEIQDGAHFELEGKVFEKINQLRTRARCKDIQSGRLYFVQGVAMVSPLSRS